MESKIHDIINSLEDKSSLSVYIDAMPHRVITWNTSREYEVDHILSIPDAIYSTIDYLGIADSAEITPSYGIELEVIGQDITTDESYFIPGKKYSLTYIFDILIKYSSVEALSIILRWLSMDYDISDYKKTTAYALHNCMEEMIGNLTVVDLLLDKETTPTWVDAPAGIDVHCIGSNQGIVGFAHNNKSSNSETRMTILAEKGNKQAEQAAKDILQVVFSDLLD